MTDLATRVGTTQQAVGQTIAELDGRLSRRDCETLERGLATIVEVFSKEY